MYHTIKYFCLQDHKYGKSPCFLLQICVRRLLFNICIEVQKRQQEYKVRPITPFYGLLIKGNLDLRENRVIV